jgi:DNA-binding transcriptional regulator YdaS (Cro superfamily)
MLKMNIEKAIKEMGGPKKCAAALGVSRPTLDKYRSGAEIPLGIVLDLAQLTSEKRDPPRHVHAIGRFRNNLKAIGDARDKIRAELQAIIEG